MICVKVSILALGLKNLLIMMIFLSLTIQWPDVKLPRSYLTEKPFCLTIDSRRAISAFIDDIGIY